MIELSFLSGLVLAGLVIVGAAVVLRSRRDPTALLTVYVVLLLLIPARLVLPKMGGVATPANVVALGLLVWWLAGVLLPSQRMARGAQPVRLALVIYVSWTLVCYALSFLRTLTDLEVSGADRRLIGLAALCGVALIISDGITDVARLETFLRRLLLIAVIVAMIGIAQFLFHVAVTPSIRPPGLVENLTLQTGKTRSIFTRPYSTALHPIEFSVVMASMVPLALHFAFFKRGLGDGLVRWGVVVVLGAATLMAVSRSGVLGLTVGMLVLSMAWDWRRRLNAFAAALVFIVFMRAAVPGLVGTLRNLFLNAETDPSVQGRLNDVTQVKQLLNGSPWTGRGPGTFNSLEYVILDNELYRTTLETGVIGLLVLLLLIATGIVTARRARAATSSAERRHLCQAVAASIATMCATMFTFDALAYPMFSGALFVFLGVAGALWRLNRDECDGVDPDLASFTARRPVTVGSST